MAEGDGLAKPVRDALVVLCRMRLTATDLGLIPLQRLGQRRALSLRARHKDAAIHLGLSAACPGIGLDASVERLVLRLVATTAS